MDGLCTWRRHAYLTIVSVKSKNWVWARGCNILSTVAITNKI